MHENLLQGYWVALYLIVASLVFISSVFAIVFVIRLLRHARRGPAQRGAEAKQHDEAKVKGGAQNRGGAKKEGAAAVKVVITPQSVQGQNSGIGASQPTGLSTDPKSDAKSATDPTGVTPHQAGVAPKTREIANAKLAADPKGLTPYSTANQCNTGTGSEPIGIAYTRLPTDLTGVTPYSTEVTHVTLATDPAEVIVYPIAAEHPSGIAHARLAADLKELTPYCTANQYQTGTGSEPIGIAYTRLPTDLTGVTPYPTEGTHVTFATDPAQVIVYPIAAENPSGVAHARLATDPMAKEQNVRVGFDRNTGFVVL